MVLGASTVTDDAEGEVVQRADPVAVAALTRDRLDDAVTALTGQIEQVPSAVSAIKVDGQRSYARVRAGQDVALAARPVTVSTFDVLAVRPGPDRWEVDVATTVSSGTYVRALARDLGVALGVGGHLSTLRRTRVGPFGLEGARTLEDLGAGAGSSPDTTAGTGTGAARAALVAAHDGRRHPVPHLVRRRGAGGAPAARAAPRYGGSGRVGRCSGGRHRGAVREWGPRRAGHRERRGVAPGAGGAR